MRFLDDGNGDISKGPWETFLGQAEKNFVMTGGSSSLDLIRQAAAAPAGKDDDYTRSIHAIFPSGQERGDRFGVDSKNLDRLQVAPVL